MHCGQFFVVEKFSMCRQAGRSYTYLSMCPCCNVVSVYPYTIKTHIQHKHAHTPAGTKKGKRRVIPIRVESKYVKDIRRIISTQSSYKWQKLKLAMAGEKESCKIEETDRGDKPLEEQVHAVKKNDTPPKTSSEEIREYLEVKSELITDIEQVVNMCTSVEGKESSTVNAVLSSGPDQYECPYCKLLFNSSDSMQGHVTKNHTHYVQTVVIKQEPKDYQQKMPLPTETIVINCTCQTCGQSFTSLSDLAFHVEDLHSGGSDTDFTLRNFADTNKDGELEISNLKNENLSVKLPEYLVGISPEKDSVDVNSVFGISKPVHRDNAAVGTKVTSEFLSGSGFSKGFTEGHEKIFSECVKTEDLVPSSSKETEKQCLEPDTKASSQLSPGLNLVIPSTEISGKSLLISVEDAVIVPDTSALYSGIKNTNNTSLIQNSRGGLNDVNSSKGRKKRKYTSKQQGYRPIKCKMVRSDNESKLSLKEKEMKESSAVSGCKSSSDSSSVLVSTVSEGKNDPIEFNMCYKCPFCDFFLFHRNYIISHVLIVHPQVKNVTFKDIVKYPAAMRASESKREYFQCPGCSFTTQHKETLMLSHVNRCPTYRISDVPFPAKVSCTLPDFLIDTHLHSALLVCPYCKITLQGREKFNSHLNKHFYDVSLKIEMSMVLPDVDKCDDDLVMRLECYMCTYCPYLHNERYTIRNHGRRHHKKELESPVIKCILLDQGSSASSYLMTFVKDIKDNSECSKSSEKEIYNDNRAGAQIDQIIEKENSKVMLIEHRSNLPTKLLLCPMCNYSTDSKRDACAHFNAKHHKRIKINDLYYMIPENLILVSVKDGDLMLSCKFCKASSQHLYPLLLHIKDKHEHLPSAEPYVPVSFGHKRKTLQNHISLSGLVKASERSGSVPTPQSSSAANYVSLICPVCRTELSEKERVEWHIHRSHPEMVETYSMVNHMVDVVSTAASFRAGESDQYDCGICYDKNFSETDFFNHLYNKHPPKIPKTLQTPTKEITRVSAVKPRCEACKQQFHDADTLSSHLHMHMSMCKFCGIVCRNCEELNIHMARLHQFGDNICVVCAGLVPEGTSLEAHLLSHYLTPTDRLPCHFCGLHIPYSAMKYHLLEKHNSSAFCQICTLQPVICKNKYHRCGCCNAVFCQQFYLDIHMLEKHSKKKLRGVRPIVAKS